MDNRNDLFHPESVNEQIDHLTRIQNPQQDGIPGAPTIAALQCIYKEDEAILERAWARLASVEGAPQTPGMMTQRADRDHYRGESTMQDTKFSRETDGPVLSSSPTFVRSPEHARAPHQRRWRVLNLIAATLTVVAIVGSMMFVLRASHQKQTGTTVAHPGASDQGKVISRFKVDPGAAAVWSPDGNRIAVMSNLGNAVNGVLQTPLKVQSWDARTGQHVLNYPISRDYALVNLAWSPDGTKLAVAGIKNIYLFNAKTAQILHIIPVPVVGLNSYTTSPLSVQSARQSTTPLSSTISLGGGFVFTSVSWSPDSKELSAGFEGPQTIVYIWDANTGSVLKMLAGFDSSTQRGAVTKVSWSPRGNMLAIQGSDLSSNVYNETQLWSTTTWQVVKRFANTSDMDWSPDGKQLALVDANQNMEGKDIRLVDVQTGQTVKQFAALPAGQKAGSPPDLMLQAVHWSPDGSRIALEIAKLADPTTGTYNSSVSIWSTTSGTRLYSFPDQASVFNAAWSPDGKDLSSLEQLGTEYVLIWKA